MKKYIWFFVGTIAFCLLGIEMFYESPVIEGDDLFVENDLGINIPIFDQSLDSTAELSSKVQHILGLYVPYISSDIADTCFAIDLRASRQSNQRIALSVRHVEKNEYEDGTYCGASRYNGHIVRLWGENIYELWTTSSIPIEVQPDTNYNYVGSSDDQCSWWLCIDMVNQKILPSECFFFCGFPYPDDSLIHMW